jgi:hypothetical protein
MGELNGFLVSKDMPRCMDSASLHVKFTVMWQLGFKKCSVERAYLGEKKATTP